MVLTIILTVLITIVTYNIISFILVACSDNGYIDNDVVVYVSMGFITIVMYGIIEPFHRYAYKPLRLKYLNNHYNSYIVFYLNGKGEVKQKMDGILMNKKYEKYCYHTGEGSQLWIEHNSERVEIRNINDSHIVSKKWLKQSNLYKGNSK